MEEARAIHARQMAPETGTAFPVLLRPSFTLGGSGAAIVWNADEFEAKVAWGLQQSPRGEVLVEESVLGWKEYELEVMRDKKDNAVIICSIENFDPMGVHTGDSITVAPAMTLTDKEYQVMRDAALAVIREIGVETGGSNIQFAVNPENGRMIVIEMNPRVSRSSALASKATGFPIAKIAAKLAVGYTLDEIPNDITRETPACFEPTIDYVVVKVPRFAFEKFPGADSDARPADEVGRRGDGDRRAPSRRALGKAHPLARDRPLGLRPRSPRRARRAQAPDRAARARPPLAAGRGHARRASRTTRRPSSSPRSTRGSSRSCACSSTRTRRRATRASSGAQAARRRGRARAAQAARHVGPPPHEAHGRLEEQVRQARLKHGIRPVFKRVDTCAAEFEAQTPYLYSTYETASRRASRRAASEDEARPTGKKKIVILGGGPNRIGQGIEFDYCCVHAVQALREDGYETIMVNCNPETVSTDYDTSDRLYFEPLTREDVLEIVDVEKPEGVIVQFGGQTPLRLAVPLQNAGVKLLGTSADAIDRAEDRERFGELLKKLDLRAPAWGTAHGLDEALARSPRDRLPGDGAAVVRARRPRHGDRPRSVGPRALRAHGHGGLAPREPVVARRRGGRAHPHRPVPARRHRGRRRRGRRRHGRRRRAASWSTSRRPASTRATRPAACRPTRWPATVEAIKTQARALAPRARRARPHERAVRGAARRARHLHPRGQPARLAHGALRLEGDRACRWPRSRRASRSAGRCARWASAR